MVQRGLSIRKGSIIVLLAALILSMISSTEFGIQRAKAASSYKVVGYYPAWGAYGRNYNVTDMDVSKVTHINYAFADICWNGIHGNSDQTGPNPMTWSCQDEVGTINVPNGTLVLGDPWIDAQKSFAGDTWDKPIKGNIGQLIKLKQSNPHLKTIISVGGWSWSNRFSDVAASETTRETFANSAVNFLRKYQFDGIDLDWEYPVGGGLAGNSVRAADKQNYTLLLQKVREKLNAAGIVDGKTYLLTIASSASPTFAQNTELSKIASILDWINIMTYDFNGGWQNISAHNAPLYYDPAAASAGVTNASTFYVAAGVQSHLDAGVPASKIVLGMPFYGRGWANVGTGNNGQYQISSGLPAGTWEAGVFDYSDLEARYINKNGYTRYWNDTAKVPYLYNASNRTYISYDDAESFGHKTAFIKSKGLGGAMFWEFSGDRNKTLLTKLTNDLSSGSGNVDTTPPTVPGNLRSTTKTSTSVSLAWDASTDNVGVTGYTVTYGSTNVNVSGTSTVISGLSPNTSYTFTVKARDAAGNVSGASNAVTVITEQAPVDTTPPTVPTNLRVTGQTSSSINLAWDASTDNVGVTGYTVTYGSTNVNVSGTSTVISGLSPNTSYTFTVKARDAAGNVSDGASITAVTETSGDNNIAPWAPNTSYKVNDLVTYEGKTYYCIQAHTTLVGWEPPIVPALWGLK
ncbi:glycosyl hydrolase family 18 protein [Cohnella terricola]|uniref:chitinase n=1 Tax=Cohnella terricola TaxID=1289167 RepID=A0A559JKY3_9BACL|nr:glycosyl hydrolase family 18 protein [Cohnella terricola]TVY00524.1 chitinase [Cohnella terricola]